MLLIRKGGFGDEFEFFNCTDNIALINNLNTILNFIYSKYERKKTLGSDLWFYT